MRKIKVGDRVKMSQLGLSQGLHPRTARVGVALRIRDDRVSVKRDGVKQVEVYHVAFWEPDAQKRGE